MKQTWRDTPDQTTPINASRLNHLETQYDSAVDYFETSVATTSSPGAIQLATTTEANAGTNASKAVTPSTLRFANSSRYEKTSSTVSGLGAGPYIGCTALVRSNGLDVLVYWDGAKWILSGSQVAGTSVQRTSFTGMGIFSPGDRWVYPTGETFTFVGSSWVPDSLSTGRLEVMGTIKRSGSNGTGDWVPLQDSGHTPIGFGSVSKGANFLRINYGFTASKVVTFSATLDDALAQSPVKIAVGASVGLTYADLFFYFHNGSGTPPPVDPATITTPNANVWIHGVFLQ